MTALPTDLAALGAAPTEPPVRVGSELRCRVRLTDGRAGLLAWLAPELAREPAMRRRYTRDLARLRELDVPGVAPILAAGPDDPAATAPPWRLRLDPAGETLESWLRRRAPAPLDEAVQLAIDLCGVLAAIHARGVVLRDLHPRLAVRGADRLWLTDIGLARVDILSTRTASSLLLEGSPYAAPEQLARTALDPRADLYAVGVILYRALTGLPPRGEGPAFLAEGPVAPPRALRPEVPPALEALVLRCLALEPAARPAGARELAAALAGERTDTGLVTLERTTCQHCGARLRLGQRLCLACGRVGVQFEHTDDGTHALQLVEAKEDADFLARLAGTLQALAAGEVPALNLVIGDARMYSKAELERRHRLPLRLFEDLSPETAERLRSRLVADGFKVKAVDVSRAAKRRRALRAAGIAAAVSAVVAAIPLIAGAPWFITWVLVGAGLLIAASLFFSIRARERRPQLPLLHLRAAPAALPASDPLVARLAALLTGEPSPEIRELVGELALAVQRLVDHRAAAPGARAEIAVVTASLAPLVALIERQVQRLRDLDRALAGLDEGALVRALAASEARGEPPARRDDLLAGLDRLRALEDERAATFHRLLEAEHLLRRAVELGLEVRDDAAEHERRVTQALHELAAGDDDAPAALPAKT
jgi:hypothetical protein